MNMHKFWTSTTLALMFFCAFLLPQKTFSQNLDPVQARCQTVRTNVNRACLQQSAGDVNDPNTVARCSVTAQREYDACVAGTRPDQLKDEGEYQIPDASSLNQFQGLTIQKVIGNVINTVTGIMGSIAFAIIVFAGFMWMTAGGNSDRQRKAMSMMLWAGMGIVVILSSYTIVRFILDAYTN